VAALHHVEQEARHQPQRLVADLVALSLQLRLPEQVA
jgi:hypothetical protein